jgi:hypothetical protein
MFPLEWVCFVGQSAGLIFIWQATYWQPATILPKYCVLLQKLFINACSVFTFTKKKI